MALRVRRNKVESLRRPKHIMGYGASLVTFAFETLRRRNRMKECEEKLGAAIRQYFRASRDSDYLAVQMASQDICTYLSWLLSEHLKRAPEWGSDERWVDGLISTKVSTVVGSAVDVFPKRNL